MDLSGTGRAVSTATESNSDDLGQVMAVIVRLRELRDQGLDNEEIARRVAVDHPRTPGGGAWSATTVEHVLRVADSSENEHRRRWRDGTAHPSEPERNFALPVETGDDGRPLVDAAGPVPISTVRRASAAALILVLIAGVIIYQVLSRSSDETTTEVDGSDRTVSDEERTSASQALLSEADGAEPAPSDQSVDSIVERGDEALPVDGLDQPADRPPLVVDIDDLPPGDPADRLSVRIEAGDGEAAENGLLPASATIRTDGKLHIEGAFRTRADADSFVEQASRVFGADALVESYTVNPAAPRAEVSDVALDKPVLFESGSAEIHPEYIPFLEACAGVLEANSHIIMSVSAYTDSIGDDDVNLELSRRRAQAIVGFYRDLAIDDVQLAASGLGEAEPVADNSTPKGRERNRRAMLQLLNIMDER